MFEDYILYPSSEKIIKNSKLEERYRDKRKEFSFSSIHEWEADREINLLVSEFINDGFYAHLSKDEYLDLQIRANKIYADPESFYWMIYRSGIFDRKECKTVDLMGFLGDKSSLLFSPEEIAKYKEYGANSITEFFMIVESFIEQDRYMSWHPGLKWIFNHNGRSFLNEISGDSNADMRLYQTDITQHLTIDPFGKKVEYRPLTNTDKKKVYAYHSTEPDLLAAILKYVRDTSITPEILEDNGKSLIEWASKIKGGQAKTAEHYFGDMHDAKMKFAGFSYPLARINDVNEYEQNGFDSIGSQSSQYNTAIGPDNELIIGVDYDKKLIPEIIYYPNEISDVIKSLFYQSANLLGRTSLNTLAGMITYRFSDKFLVDQKRIDDYGKEK